MIILSYNATNPLHPATVSLRSCCKRYYFVTFYVAFVLQHATGWVKMTRCVVQHLIATAPKDQMPHTTPILILNTYAILTSRTKCRIRHLFDFEYVVIVYYETNEA